MAEFSVREAKCFNGDPLLAIEGFSLPGLDEIQTRTTAGGIEWLTFGTARSGIERRGNGGLAELFALGPADLPVAKLRQMIWLAALFGVDRYVLAVNQLDFRGNIGKPDWFNPMSADQPWFASAEFLAEDAGIAAGVARKRAVPELEVRYPADEYELHPLLEALVRAQRPWRLIASEATPSPEAPEVLAGLRLRHPVRAEKRGGFICGRSGCASRPALAAQVVGGEFRRNSGARISWSGSMKTAPWRCST